MSGDSAAGAVTFSVAVSGAVANDPRAIASKLVADTLVGEGVIAAVGDVGFGPPHAATSASTRIVLP